MGVLGAYADVGRNEMHYKACLSYSCIHQTECNNGIAVSPKFINILGWYSSCLLGSSFAAVSIVFFPICDLIPSRTAPDLLSQMTNSADAVFSPDLPKRKP